MKNLLLAVGLMGLFSTYTLAQWSTDAMENNPIAIAPGEEAIPKVSSNTNGTTYIAWFSNESGNYNVRLQKLDQQGNVMWDEEGLMVSDNSSMSWLTDWDMTVDAEDCAILTFQDIRNGDNDAFSYRISPDGEFLWGDDGIEMSSGPAFDASPKVCVTSNGNAVFAWQAEDVIIMQKISPEGAKLWGDDGITLSGNNTYSWPQLLAVGNDNVILKYFEDSGPVWSPTRHVYAQQYDSDGNPVWDESVIVSNAGGISAWTQIFPFINDGNDGFFIAWHDDRNNDMHSSVFVQHIDADGSILLGDNGTEASTQASRQNFYPHLSLPAESEYIYVYWNEMDSDQNQRGIYGQKISSIGEREWTNNGKAFIELSSTNVYPFSASASDEDMVIFYEAYFNGIDAAILAMRIDSDGSYVWSQEMIELCSVESEKVHAVAGRYINEQWITTWEDSRNGNRDIYAQNIQLDGSLGSISETAEIEIFPDTLFIEENAMDYYIYIYNPSPIVYTIESISENSEYWYIEDIPEFPYDLNALDTLVLYVPIYYVGNGNVGDGYVYDTLFVHGLAEINTSIVSLNLDILSGISEQEQQTIRVYPNPSGSYFTFEIEFAEKGELEIVNSTGQIIRKFPLAGACNITWDGRDEQNELMPAGIYMYQLVSGKNLLTGKILLIR